MSLQIEFPNEHPSVVFFEGLYRRIPWALGYSNYSGRWILIISQRVPLTVTLELGVLTSTRNGYIGPTVSANRFGIPFSSYRGYATVECRRTFGDAFPILKGRQLIIHRNNSEWSFSNKRNIIHSNNDRPNGPNRKKMGSNY